MKVDKYEKLTKSKYRLYLSNGEVIDTYDDIIIETSLLLEKNISQSLYNTIIESTNLYPYYLNCLKYINIRIRSTKEIHDYLTRKGLKDKNKQEKIITHLQNKHLLNDEKFIECFINDKLKFTSWGPYKIKNELKQKHAISSETISKFDYLFKTEVISNKLTNLLKKQISLAKSQDNYQLKNKLYNRFVNLGYEKSMVIELLDLYL